MKNGKPFVRGVATCGSVWECIQCSMKVASRRRDEAKELIMRAVALGWQPHLATFTIPHNNSDSLADLIRALTGAWSGLTSGGASKSLRFKHGVLGFVRVLEVTHGENGWHPHFHVLFFTKSTKSNPELAAWRGDLLEKWSKEANKHGREVKADGVHLQRVDDSHGVANYLLKHPDLGPAKPNVTLSDWDSTTASRTPWDILFDYVDHERPEDAALWLEYVAATKGKQSCRTSRDLAKTLGLGQEKSDAALAAEELDEAEDLLDLQRDGARRLLANRVDFRRLLELLERQGLTRFCEELDARGIGYALTEAGQAMLWSEALAAAEGSSWAP